MERISDTIIRYLRDHQTFLILIHKKPDGDAVGSAIALGKGLKSIGKDVDYCVDVPLEDKLNFFDEIARFNGPLKDHYDGLVFLDCSTQEYAFTPDPMPAGDKIIVLDHHRSNDAFGDLNHVEETSSTGEIVFRVLKALDITLDDEMVDAVFTSISTDTGSFQFSNVTTDTHRILSELYKYQDNFAPLSKKLHHEKSFAQMKMYGEAIESLTLLDKGRLSWTCLNRDTIDQYGGMINITDDIANIGMNVTGVIISATLKEQEPGHYRVSLRARSPFDIDVSVIAKKYGGGGHQRAAGFDYTGELSDLQDELSRFLEASSLES